MTERTVEIVNSLGMHARPAAQLVRLASGFQSEIEIAKDGMSINGKSIMGVMMLAAEFGSSVVVRATGSDETAAVEAIAKLIADGFGES